MEKDTFNKRIVWIGGIILLVISFVFSIGFGAERIHFINLFNSNSFERTIVLQLRLPRALLVLLTGLLLGGSGAVFQMFFRNPLAEPGIMGISSGATLGAVSASLIFSNLISSNVKLFSIISPINLSAFVGALLSGLIVTTISFAKSNRKSTVMLLLCGTALGTLYSSISSIIMLTSRKDLHTIYSWLMGSFNGHGWNELFFILLPSIVSIIIMIFISFPLNLLSSGEKNALSLGLNIKKLRILVLLCGSLAISAAVCAGGTISFVGLIAPHLVRKVHSSKGQTLIPLSMITGAIILLLSDTLARIIIAPSELPAGIITALLGIPFFILGCLKLE
ncbi:MAG: iron ABC transporter permease [Treponema sp.]|nr:iron ABC transporter permease [Treponema sp.]